MAGRPSKLTPEITGVIVNSIRVGYTMRASAQVAGISEDTLFFWLQLGANRKEKTVFSEFSEAVFAAKEAARNAKIKANPRPLARARYEHDATPDEQRLMMYKEIHRLRKEGRVQYAAAREALEMVLADFEDELAVETVSWVDV